MAPFQSRLEDRNPWGPYGRVGARHLPPASSDFAPGGQDVEASSPLPPASQHQSLDLNLEDEEESETWAEELRPPLPYLGGALLSRSPTPPNKRRAVEDTALLADEVKRLRQDHDALVTTVRNIDTRGDINTKRLDEIVVTSERRHEEIKASLDGIAASLGAGKQAPRGHAGSAPAVAPKTGGGGEKTCPAANAAFHAIIRKEFAIGDHERLPPWPKRPGEKADANDPFIDLSTLVVAREQDFDPRNPAGLPPHAYKEDGSRKPLRLDLEGMSKKSEATNSLVNIMSDAIYRDRTTQFPRLRDESRDTISNACRTSFIRMRGDTLRHEADPEKAAAQDKRNRETAKDRSRRADKAIAYSKEHARKTKLLDDHAAEADLFVEEAMSEDVTDKEASARSTLGKVAKASHPMHRSAEAIKVIDEAAKDRKKVQGILDIKRTGDFNCKVPAKPLSPAIKRWMVCETFAKTHPSLVVAVSDNSCSFGGKFGAKTWGSTPAHHPLAAAATGDGATASTSAAGRSRGTA